MSGGSMSYLYGRVADAHFSLHTPERRALKKHLELLSVALKKIEWNDSGDGADGEDEAIRACLHDGAVLEQTISDARTAMADLHAELRKLGREVA